MDSKEDAFTNNQVLRFLRMAGREHMAIMTRNQHEDLNMQDISLKQVILETEMRIGVLIGRRLKIEGLEMGACSWYLSGRGS